MSDYRALIANAVNQVKAAGVKGASGLSKSELEGLSMTILTSRCRPSEITLSLIFESLARAAQIADLIANSESQEGISSEGEIPYALDLSLARWGTYILGSPASGSVRGKWTRLREWIDKEIESAPRDARNSLTVGGPRLRHPDTLT